MLDTNIKRFAEKGVSDYEFTIELPPTIPESEVCTFFNYDSSVSSN